MKLLSRKLLKSCSIFIFFLSLIVIPSQLLGANENITVDVNQVFSNVSNHPIGLNVSFVADRPSIRQPLNKISIGSLRYTTNEYYLFDSLNPTQPKISIQDPSIWQVKSFGKPDGTWYNNYDFDRFMQLCQEIGAEPFVVVPIDAIAYTGSSPHSSSEEVIQAAANWVKYANKTKQYGVKYWEIGNESNIQAHDKIHWTPEQYGQTVVKIAEAMKKVDPSIMVGANGMKLTDPDDWWDRLMPIIKNDVDFLITHQYSWLENYTQWENDPYEYTYNIEYTRDAIKKYNPKLKLNVTENSSFNPAIQHPNNVWKMLHNFEIMGQMLRYPEVDYVHFWTARWLEEDPYSQDTAAFNKQYKLMPMGYPLPIWSKFIKKQMVYADKMNGKIRSWASYNSETKSLSLFLLNKGQTTQDIKVELKNYQAPVSKAKVWTLSGAAPESKQVTWGRSGFAILNGSNIQTKLKPLSVTVIEF